MTNDTALAVRNCIAAIATDDPIALHAAWPSRPLEQAQAEKLALQAWRRDKERKRIGFTMAKGGLTSAIYVAISEQTRALMPGQAVDNASIILAVVALHHDDVELMAVVKLWDDTFDFVKVDAMTPGGGEPDTVENVCAFMEATKAPKCAAFWRHWHVGKALGDIPRAANDEQTVQVVKCTPPKPLQRELGKERVGMLYEHPNYTRAKTLSPDATKTVFLVQLGAPVGLLIETTTRAGRLMFRDLRNRAQQELETRGYTVLETCNMRIALYDHGGLEDTFKEDAAAAARVPGLALEVARRILDPGPCLVVPDECESLLLMGTANELL